MSECGLRLIHFSRGLLQSATLAQRGVGLAILSKTKDLIACQRATFEPSGRLGAELDLSSLPRASAAVALALYSLPVAQRFL